MNLKAHYNTLYKESIAEISKDNYDIDAMIDSKHDDRFGISLLIRPSEEVKSKVRSFLNELKQIEPDQYYYPDSDIHITIISIISCYKGFDINTIEPSKYIELIKKCLPLDKNTKIHIKGLTASNSCIMLKGFVNNDSINHIRTCLRLEFKHSELEQSLDERYKLKTAHSTIVRFRKELSQKTEFLKLIDRHVDYDFGTFEIEKIELVYNDWYHRKALVQKLYEFKI